MGVSARSYLTSGIAALGVGAIALSPIQPVPDHAPASRTVETMAVNLAASIDPITPWVDTFKTSFDNIQTLVKFYLDKPFPLLQTIGANWGTYFGELTNGQAALIPEQIWNNVQTFFTAPWDPGTGATFPAPPLPEEVFLSYGDYVSSTDIGNGFQRQNTIPGTILQEAGVAFEKCLFEGTNCDFPGQVAPLQNFLSTPYSGQLVALVGPLISPLVQVVKSFTAVGQYFQDGKVLEAVNELINIPANMTNAFLNGAGYLDLTSIVSQLLPLPVNSIGVNLGGLLNAVPFDGSLSNPDNPPTYTGGVGFDAVAAVLGPAKFQGLPNGWFGSTIGLGQFLSEEMLVVPPPTAATAAAAPAPKVTASVPAAAAAVEAPAAEDPAAAPPPVAPSADAGEVEAPAPLVIDASVVIDAPVVADVPDAAEAPAPAAADTRAHRGGGKNKSDNSSQSSGRGHRGAA